MKLHELQRPPPSWTDLYLRTWRRSREVKADARMETFYRVELPDGQELGHQPGQFVEVSIFGVGEAPFSISSSPTSGRASSWASAGRAC